jgi:beta-glucosidase
VSVDVTNTGKTAGKEIVQLYLRDLVRSVTPPTRQLKGFAKIDLKPGETKTVKLTLTAEDLSFIGRDNKRIVEPGDFEVMVANLKGAFTLK